MNAALKEWEKNGPGSKAGIEHPVAAIDQREPDREAAERFHQRARPLKITQPTCSIVLKRGDLAARPSACIGSSSVKALTVRTPCTVSCMVWQDRSGAEEAELAQRPMDPPDEVAPRMPPTPAAPTPANEQRQDRVLVTMTVTGAIRDSESRTTAMTSRLDDLGRGAGAQSSGVPTDPG